MAIGNFFIPEKDDSMSTLLTKMASSYLSQGTLCQFYHFPILLSNTLLGRLAGVLLWVCMKAPWWGRDPPRLSQRGFGRLVATGAVPTDRKNEFQAISGYVQSGAMKTRVYISGHDETRGHVETSKCSILHSNFLEIKPLVRRIFELSGGLYNS